MQQAAKIVTLPTSKKQASQARNTKRATRALRRQSFMAAGIGFVAVALIALSLKHLAQGVEIVTHTGGWQAWALAIGIDLGFIATELAQITVGEKLRKSIVCYTKPLIIGTMAGSAAMNAFAFASDASGWQLYAAAALGLAIPALIYALTRIGAAIYIDTHSRS